MKCGSNNCEAEATHRVFWPGQTMDKCEPCTSAAREVASAMGFALGEAKLTDGKPQ